MADSKSKMGRPPVPKADRIDQRVPVMLKKDEKELVRSKASKEGMTVSEWSRRVLVKAAGGSIE